VALDATKKNYGNEAAEKSLQTCLLKAGGVRGYKKSEESRTKDQERLTPSRKKAGCVEQKQSTSTIKLLRRAKGLGGKETELRKPVQYAEKLEGKRKKA